MKKITAMFLTISLFMTSFLSIQAHDEKASFYSDVLPKDVIEITPNEEVNKLARDLNMDVLSFKIEHKSLKSLASDITGSVTVKNYFVEKGSIQTRGSGDKYYEDSIVNYSAVVYSTIYYSTYTDSYGINYGKLTGVSGGVKGLNSGFAVVNQNISYETFGAHDGSPIDEQEKNGIQVQELGPIHVQAIGNMLICKAIIL